MTAQATARKLAENELLITRVFDAPLALVWRIWENRDHVIRWWGPEGFACTSFDLDFRPGGAWRASIVSDAYGTSWSSGKFREIEKKKRIVFTFAWEEGSGVTTDTIITVTFSERDGKTVQTVHQAPFDLLETRDSHVAGWNSLFNKQQAYVERLAEAGRPKR